jgi:hypothetical protein
MASDALQTQGKSGNALDSLECKRRSENRPRHAVRAGDAAEEN